MEMVFDDLDLVANHHRYYSSEFVEALPHTQTDGTEAGNAVASIHAVVCSGSVDVGEEQEVERSAGRRGRLKMGTLLPSGVLVLPHCTRLLVLHILP